MHAVVVRVTIHDEESAQQMLHGEVVPRVSGSPGFVAGYWTRNDDGTNGSSMIVFESEDAARAVGDQLRAMPAGDRVTVENVEVREVIANA